MKFKDLLHEHLVNQLDGGYELDGVKYISDEAEALVDEAKEMAYATGKNWKDVLLTILPKS